MGGGAFPGGKATKEWLDPHFPDRAVYVIDETGHNAVINSVALKLAGITKDTPNPEYGVIDRKVLFVGSLNLDPRSIDINSEMGLFLTSPRFSGQYAEQLEADLRSYTYRVALDDEGRLEWRYTGDGELTTLHSEPKGSFRRRLGAGFYGALPLENQL